MSNLKPAYVDFTGIKKLIEHAETFESMADNPPKLARVDFRLTVRMYEKRALEDIATELGGLLNETNERVRYLKNLLAEEF
jgi:hypothetical protein